MECIPYFRIEVSHEWDVCCSYHNHISTTKAPVYTGHKRTGLGTPNYMAILMTKRIHQLTDPNDYEESLCGAVLTVTATENGILVGCNKSGGSPLSSQDLALYVNIAVERAKVVTSLINTV
ncbi:uncharacterized protein LOC134192305 [Corticium candelabrum]|uniref:uncharacterized protein LOC134192305 n=1 Tax=Corticium candelabrum TaxID=121492 RepID=UPI002E25C44A|nr:uncharacterized protein LOC134192305 [Corticium candelabrum]